MKLLLFYFIFLSAFAQSAPHDRWQKLFNTNIDSIHQVYSTGAILISPDGIIYRTAPERSVFYTNLKNALGPVESVTIIRQEKVAAELSFEVGYFVTRSNKKFMHLIIGKQTGNDFVREVEILSEWNSGPVNAEGINEARNVWMKLCNSHRASDLVSNSYTSNAVYYNNKRILVGTNAITQEYRYMNNPGYQLTLTPLIVEAAGKNIAFEIGQCSGSYKGKYALVWKKIGNVWQVLFDSN